MEDDLVASGRFVRVVTRGRRSGEARAVTVGFTNDADGALVIAAGSPDADWALNLLDDPRCSVRVADEAFEAEAVPLEGAAFARAIRELILRYGTPAETLGRGPAFRLEPVDGARRRGAG